MVEAHDTGCIPGPVRCHAIPFWKRSELTERRIGCRQLCNVGGLKLVMGKMDLCIQEILVATIRILLLPAMELVTKTMTTWAFTD